MILHFELCMDHIHFVRSDLRKLMTPETSNSILFLGVPMLVISKALYDSRCRRIIAIVTNLDVDNTSEDCV